MSVPILQFGTSRFLLAHVAFFVSEALARGEAIGGIGVVQTTSNPSSRARIDALAATGRYPVRIRGRADGVAIERVVECHAVRRAWTASTDWAAIRRAVVDDVRVIVSNTADAGYRLDERDSADVLADATRVPHSFPAKLLTLLHARWRERPADGVTLLPCELIARNGDTLRDIVLGLARQWHLPDGLIAYLLHTCVWVNSLVDRIVSGAIDPVGAIAEPYALWAVERHAGMTLPCTHEQIVVTDDLAGHERLKLFFLNLGHTWLAEQWLRQGRPPDETVREAMGDPRLGDGIEHVWRDEVLPVFVALGQRDAAERYIDTVRDRLLNPYLDHRIADIANHHDEKIRRRIRPLIALADAHAPGHAQPRLRGLLAAHDLAQPS
ncbi:D-mannonate oxidoreductase [Burkholderia plantarii]|uniref:mannitol dehydrogenase family protein n=1 Tax=Burkholderia plantarii TaxID=41899 RepID=UPI0006D8B83D|nr:D-mannonate oxidoreductase [Burkholderia plantarii]ALK34711.1 Mannitol dehydrogenase-like protein [Burkholderia plantarii]GLZ23063.1 D-mannonate oxidoreductase [Burkholderia plantarii]